MQKTKENLRQATYAKPKFIIGLDSRRSFIHARDVKIWGAKIGLEFDQRFRLGFGIYGLSPNNPYYRNFVIDQDTIQGRLHFNYLAYFLDYVYLRTKRWELSSPLYVGAGITRFDGLDSTTQKGVGLVEFSLQTQFKVFNWIGVGAGVGYRYMFIPNKQIEENFNNPIYALKLRIWLGPIWRGIRGRPNEEDKLWRKNAGNRYHPLPGNGPPLFQSSPPIFSGSQPGGF